MLTDKSGPRLIWLSGFSVLVGCLLLVLSVQQFRSYSLLARVPSIVEQSLKAGDPMPASVLDDALQLYQDAAALLPSDAFIQQDLGRLELRRSIDPALSADARVRALHEASASFRASIADAPSRAFSWSLETYAQSELSAPSADISNLFRMSYFLGPHEGSSILLRAQVAAQNWDRLDLDTQNFARDDFKELWQYDVLHQSLAEIYLNSPLATRTVIRNTVLTTKTDEIGFDRLVMKISLADQPH